MRNQREINGENQYKTNNQKDDEITIGHQHKTDVLKTYVCCIWPSLSIGSQVRFRNGLFETNDPETQRLIERAHGFGIQIQEVNDGGCKTEIKMKVIQELGPGPINETDMKLICPLGSLR